MADFLDTSYIAAANVSRNDATRVITISGHHNITGAVDDMAAYAGYTFLYTGSNARISVGGSASGVIGTDAGTIKIVEASDSFKWGSDNFSSSASIPSRIYGSSNTAEFRNLQWVHNSSGGRSDWDVHRGTSADGTSGPQCTFRGLSVLVQGSTGTFNHVITTTRLKIERHSLLDYGLKFENRTSVSVCFEISVSLNQTPDGIVAVESQGVQGQGSSRPTSGGGSEQIVCLFDNTQTIRIKGLACRSISSIHGSGTRFIELVDPQVLAADGTASVGIPPRPNAGRRVAGVKVYRTQPISFTGVGIQDGATIHAFTTSTNSAAANATAATSGNAAAPELITHVIDTSDSQTAIGTYNIVSNSWDTRKASHQISTALGTGSPSTISISTTANRFPDGSLPAARSGSAAVANLDDLFLILQKYELDNPQIPAYNKEIAFFDTDGAMHIAEDLRLDYGPSDGSLLVLRQTDTPAAGETTLRAKCASTMTASSKGIGKIESDEGNFANTGNVTRQFPETDASGSSALVSFSAASNDWYVGCWAADGTRLGTFQQYAGTPLSFLATASQTSGGNLKFAASRAGYTPGLTELDASSGGTFSVAVPAGQQQRLPDGSVMYDQSVSDASLTAVYAVAANGNPSLRIDVGNAAVSVASVYRVLHAALTTEAGTKFTAFGGVVPTYLIDSLNGNSLYLGSAANKLRRKLSTDSGATLLGAAYPAATALDTANGEVRFKIAGEVPELTLTEANLLSIARTNWGLSFTAGNQPASTTYGGRLLQTITPETLAPLKEQNARLASAQPITFTPPLTPQAALLGMPGQTSIRDAENQWDILADGVVVAEDLSGEITFPEPANSTDGARIRFSLDRQVGSGHVNYDTETILLFDYYPTSFNNAADLTLLRLGSLDVSVKQSATATAPLLFGLNPSHQEETTQHLHLNQWNSVCISIQKQESEGYDNYPRIRVSVRGQAQQVFNDGSQEVFGSPGSVGADTAYLTMGLENSSARIRGRVRGIVFHPNNAISGSQTRNSNGELPGVDFPNHIRWNPDAAMYEAMPWMDRVEGIAVNNVEDILEGFQANGVKTTAADKTAQATASAGAVWDRATSAITQAGSIGVHTKGLTNFEDQDFSDQQLTDIAASAGEGVLDANLVDHNAANTFGNRIANVNSISPLSAQATAEAILDAQASSHNDSGTIGEALQREVDVDGMVDKVWDEAFADHNITTSMGWLQNHAVRAGGVASEIRAMEEFMKLWAAGYGTAAVSTNAEGRKVVTFSHGDEAVLAVTLGSENGVRTASGDPPDS